MTLRTYDATANEIRLQIDTTSDQRFLIEFIGKGGRVLTSTHGNAARYGIAGNEGYVRTRVTDSNGRRAWTQPVLVRR